MTQRAGHKPIIGLAGGIGSGKSTVARQLASLGCAVIDSDELAQAALDEPAVIQTLIEWWGPSVLAQDGRVDRKAVGRIVFCDDRQLKRLESLVHPRVHAARAELREKYRKDDAVKAVVEDAPLLFEAGIAQQCDAVIFVASPLAQRLKRVASSRGWTAQELHRRESRQLPLDFKAQHADYVLDNDGSELEIFSHVRRVLSEILQRFN